MTGPVRFGYSLGMGLWIGCPIPARPAVRASPVRAAALGFVLGGALLVSTGCAPIARVLIPKETVPQAVSAEGFSWPANGVVTSRFGERTLKGKTKNHEGIDIAGHKRFAPVYAAKDGVVGVSTRGRTYGKWVEIRHDGGYVTRYAHLSWQFVRPRFKVRRGFIIGRIGNTGRSYGAHLHFEVFSKGRRIDPLAVLPPLGGKSDLVGYLIAPLPDALLPRPPGPGPARAGPWR